MIAVEFSGRFDSGVGAGGSEVVAHDAATQRLFVTNGTAGMIDVLDFADPTDMSRLFSIDLNGLPNFGGVQSVAAHNGTVAAAMANADPALDGFVSFFDAATGNLLNTVTVGNLPDMLTFTPDGTKVLVANEGERVDALTDPAGSVSIIDISGGVAAATVTTADFTAFDGQEAALRATGVRIFSGKSVSEDVEPEYIAVAPDGATAYVALQEANALAVLDLATSTITAILPLGTKDHSLPGNELDPSDRDSGIEIANHPVKGFFMPDAIAAYDANGQTFIVTANEGDSRDLSFFSEEARIADLTLDPAAFPNAAALQDNAVLGRLKTTTENGDTDNDGDFDELFSFGARSFSIFDSAGNLVFDSGADFENIISTLLPTLHNAQNFDPSEFDGRSDDKGPEPEGVTVGTVNGATYAFIGLERVGGVMVYDITDPANASFVDFVAPDGVDIAPEVLQFVDAADSPTGEAILLTSNEVSGTTAAFQVSDTYTLQILHASDLEGGVDAIGRAPNFAAIEAFLEGEIANSITLSAGDNYIPGPFFSAAGDQATFRDGDVFNDAYNTIFGTTEYDSLREGGGRVDITIMNAIGFDASAVGNHEFDAGSATFAELAAGDQRGADGPAGDRWVGAQFPYLSANLDFTGDGATSGIFTDEILPTAAFKDAPASEGVSPKIAPAAIHIENGEPIGIVGATTQLIASISSPGGVEETTGGVNDMQALADVLNPVIQEIIDSGVNKIILVSHLQQIALEKQLAGLLHGVDIIIAGGSDTLQADAQDTLRPGDVAAEGYPFLTQNADGKDVAIVSTDGEYSYVGRLVVDFDANGDLIASSIDENVSGAFATDDATVAALYGTDDPFAAGSSAAVVQDLVDAVEGVVIAKDSNVLGFTDVYLEGRRSEVRTEETNLGDLTADANLAYAQAVTAPDFAPMMTGENGFTVLDVLTVGSTLEGTTGALNSTTAGDYTPVGIMDGIGAMELDANTVRIFVNHELSAGAGDTYSVSDGAGGTFELAGARISYFDIDKATKTIIDGGIAFDTIIGRDGNPVTDANGLDAGANGFDRFCSSVLVEADEFGAGMGVADAIYFAGEETSTVFGSPHGGAQWALDVATGTLYDVPDMGRGTWENVTAIDTGNDTHVAFLMGDDFVSGPAYLYVGEKDPAGGFLARNGLEGGKMFVWVSDTGEIDARDFNELEDGAMASLAGTWVEVAVQDPAQAGQAGFDDLGYKDDTTLRTDAHALGAFQFSRPEDVAYNPANPQEAIFASTGRQGFANNEDQVGTLYKFDFDFANIDAPVGGVQIVYDGDADATQALRSPDNLDWADDGFIYVQEDRAAGGLFGAGAANPNEASIVRIDPATGAVTRVAEIDRSAVPFGQTDTSPADVGNWESSGILDVSELFGEDPGELFLFDVQAHSIRSQTAGDAVDGKVEGGQLAFLTAPGSDVTVGETQVSYPGFEELPIVSIKNGGGIRAEIGEIDGYTGDLLPPQENVVSGKPEGGISQLDVENALRFNNGLTLITLDQEELVEVLEHAVANSGPGATPGQFLQAAGVNFTYSTDLPSGARIIDAELSDGTQLVDNGVFVGDSAEDVRVVTLNFLAGGGDNYPFPALGENRIDLVGTLTDPGTSDFATPGSEQDALAEFLQANHGDPASAFDVADTEAGSDPRFNAVAIAEETGTAGDDSLIGDQTVNILTGGAGDDTIAGKEGFDILTGGAGNDMVIGDDADSIVIADTLGNASITQLSASHVMLFNAFLGAGEQFDAAAPVFRVVSADGSDVVQGGQFVFDDTTVSVGSSGALQLEAAGSLNGGAGNETFVGSTGDDILSGNGGDDVLIGGKGDDTVSGGAGSDMLIADAGNDTLSSGSGDDIIGVVTTDGELSLLFGGSGDDVFAFAAAGATTGLDTAAVIVDFTAGEDTINFAALRTGGGAALTFADIAAVMADDANGDAAIDLSGLTDEHGNAVAGTLTLAGVSSAAVTASDFEFNSAIDFSGVSGLFDPGA